MQGKTMESLFQFGLGPVLDDFVSADPKKKKAPIDLQDLLSNGFARVLSLSKEPNSQVGMDSRQSNLNKYWLEFG